MATRTPSPTRQEKVRQASSMLDEHLHALAEQMRQGKSEALLRYLEFTATFHRYSFSNVLLIVFQKPEATHVAGLRQWNRQGRRVKPGEKGIMIFAPMFVKKRREPEQTKDSGESKETMITLFKIVYVYDVSQTEGLELPSLIHSQGDAGPLYPALQRAIRGIGITLDVVGQVPGSASAHGASYGGRIAIRDDLSPAEGFRTLVHELAHEKLHWQGEKDTKTIPETEADATAYVVCRHFGLTTDSADYLLLYDATPDVLLSRLDTVRDTAADIIAAIEKEIGAAVPASDDV